MVLPNTLQNKLSGIGIECESIGLQATVVYKDINDLIRMALKEIYYVEGESSAAFTATTIDGVATCVVKYAELKDESK